MAASLFPDFACSIRYDLTHRPSGAGHVEIVLDLFRGAVPVLTRTVATVTPGQVTPVLMKCRRYLERRGAHTVANAVRPVQEFPPDPRLTAPLAAFDFMFEAG